MKNYEFYDICCVKSLGTPDDPYKTEEVNFRVRATSHTQHDPYSTHLDGLAKGAEKRIADAREAGYCVSTVVGGRDVKVNN